MKLRAQRFSLVENVEKQEKSVPTTRALLQLSEIPWGKPDPKLAPLVCQSIVDTMHGRFPRPDRHLLRSVLNVCAWLFVGVVLLLVIATYARPARSAPPTSVVVPLN